MSVNYTLYRRGEEAFKLESRRQGHIRKVTQASFKEEIMANDTIEMTLVSTELLDFHLRDYIVHDGRPYFLNRLPESSIDTSKRYTYKISFEGAMYELGRVAFVLKDAFGYDYYGMLSEFGRLVVDNMNRINMWIDWSYNGNTYSGKLRGTYTVHGQEQDYVVYCWGLVGANYTSQMGTVWIYTLGFPSLDNNAYAYIPSSPVGSPEYDYDMEITAIHQWSLDFPESQETPAVYPQPTNHVPATEISSSWDVEYEDVTRVINDMTTESSYTETRDDGHEYLHEFTRNSDIFYDTINFPSTTPSSVNDIEIYQQHYVWVRLHRVYRIVSGGSNIPVDSSSETIHGYRQVTRKAHVSSTWQIVPVVPPSGEYTGNDEITESLLLSYDQHSCLAVLQDITQRWKDWEWRIFDVEYGFVNGEMLVSGTIRLRKKDTNENDGAVHDMGFGKSGGLSSIKRKYSDGGNIPSRVYFYGGSKNLPEYYRNSRLCLPNKTKEESYIDFSEFANAVFQIGIQNTTCEEVRVLDDIYPANSPFEIKAGWAAPAIATQTFATGVTRNYLQLEIPVDEFFDIKGKWEDYSGQWPEELDPPSSAGINPNNPTDRENYPDFCEWLVLMQLDDTWISGEGRVNRARYITYYTGRSKYMIQGESPRFVFQTGALAGYALSIYSITQVDDVYVILLNVVEEDNEEVDGYYTPNEDLCCTYGDKFIIDNINMPADYTYYRDGGDGDFSAEKELWDSANDVMNEIVEKIDYEVEVSRDHVARHNDVFRAFDTLVLNDPLTGGTITFRVVSVDYDLVDGYIYKLTVTNRRV